MTTGIRNYPRTILSTLERIVKDIKGRRGRPDGFVGTDSHGLAETEQLGTGTASATSYLRGDNVWAVPAGTATAGDVVGDDVSVSVQNIAAYNNVDGKHITELTGTQGMVLYHNGTVWSKLSAGTAGHFLQTGGAGANPVWAAEASGAGDVTAGDLTVTSGNIVAYNGGGGTSIVEFSGVQGDIAYHNGASWVKLAAGTAGHVLRTQGASANPKWATDTIHLDNTATTAQIQSALDSLTAGGVVHLAPGDYTLTATLYLSHPGLVLRGSGKGNTNLYYTADRNTDIVVIEHTYCTVEDLSVYGTNPAHVNGSGAAGTGRGIVIAQPDASTFFANPTYAATLGPGGQSTFPTVRRVQVMNTASWCIYDSGLKTFTTASNNWTTPLADSGFCISVLLLLEDVDVAFWASNGGIFVGGGSASPHMVRCKTNGYTYNTYTQVTGSGAVPKNDMGGVFFYNSYGAEILDSYFQSPADGGILPDTDACMLSFLNSHSMMVVNPKFEVLSGPSLPDSNGGAGGRQYYFITACNSGTISIVDSDFQSRLTDTGSPTLSNWGAKIFRSSDNPGAVGISFIRGVCFQGRTVTGAASGARDTGDPVTWDRNDFVFAGNLDGDSLASTISIEDFFIINDVTGKHREASIPFDSQILVANCTTAGVPSTTLTTTTGTFGFDGTGANQAINRGDTLVAGAVTTRVQYITSTTTLVTEDAVTVAPGTTIAFTPAGMNIAVKPNFRLRQKRSERISSFATCDLTGAGDKDDFVARTALSQPLFFGTMAYVASGDLTEGLWITNSHDNFPRQIPFYRKRSSFWSGPTDGDLNYLTSNASLHTYSSGSAEWKQVFSLLRLSTATGDLPYYSAASTPAKLTIGTVGAKLMVVGGVPAWGFNRGSSSIASRTTSLGLTTLLTGTAATAGFYRAHFYVKCTAAEVGAVVAISLTFNDGTGQTHLVQLTDDGATSNVQASLTTLNESAHGSVPFYLAASQNVTYIAAITSGGTGAYSIEARLEALG